MKLLPKSLFGRITLVLVGGLIAVQLMTTAMHISERNSLVFRIGSQQAAVRIGDIVRVLEATSPGERSSIMRAVPAETLKLSYGNPAGSDGVAGEESELLVAAREALALALDPGVAFRVIDAQPAFIEPDSWYAREFGERPGVRIHAAVRLQDGTWITADSVEPARPTIMVHAHGAQPADRRCGHAGALFHRGAAGHASALGAGRCRGRAWPQH